MENIFSPFWYRVTSLKPQLRQHVDISSHKVRDNTWYIYQDVISGRSHQFSPIAHFFISLMDGEQTVQQLWDALNEKYGDESPNQDHVIQLLAQLHNADLMKTDVNPSIEVLFSQLSNDKNNNWKKKLSNPFSLRFSLFDPEALLNMAQPWCSWLFTKTFALMCLVFLVFSTMTAIQVWDSLTYFAEENAFSQSNIFLLLLTYPIVKLFHEFGHAIATKHWGGEVHDMGIILIFFTPVPYVDASSSTAFRSKYKRMVVSSIGIIVELLLASFALFVWLNVEAGLIQNIAFNIMLIGGISTLLFNGNPLLRFDAYYVLSDMLEIPNLAQRSNKYIGYLILRFIFGVTDYPTQVKAKGEAFWFVLYSITSFTYRMFLIFLIILFISSKYFFLGIVLGIWIAILQVALPLGKNINFVFNDASMKQVRLRVWASMVVFFTLSYHFIFNVPIPYATTTEGIISLAEYAQIRTHSDGFISALPVILNDKVVKGSIILQSNNKLLESKINALNSELTQLEIEYRSQWNSDRIKRKIITEKINSIKSDIENFNVTKGSLTLHSPTAGQVIIPHFQDLEGQYKEKGTLLGYVLNESYLKTRLLVNQNDMNLIQDTDEISIRFVSNIAKEYDVKLIRKIPAATNILPSSALGTDGGGKIYVDPKNSSGLKSLEKYFEIWTTLPPAEEGVFIGSRVYIKFVHTKEPLSIRLKRWINQLFLTHFNA